jgi:hypothetical protein
VQFDAELAGASDDRTFVGIQRLDTAPTVRRDAFEAGFDDRVYFGVRSLLDREPAPPCLTGPRSPGRVTDQLAHEARGHRSASTHAPTGVREPM